MKVAIFGQTVSEHTLEAFQKLYSCLQTYDNVSIVINKAFYQHLSKTITIQNSSTYTTLNASYDLVITIGGDGTILRASTLIHDLQTPIVGINTGRLGFLATIQINYIERAIQQLFKKNYSISKRSLLTISTTPKTPSLNTLNFALNEIAVSRKNTTSMITVETKLDNEHLTSYWSDGLIIATPTGSTGYSLSCGGPVITPSANSFVLTPIAPHNLNARPLVIPDDTVIQLKVSGRENQHLVSLDSRIETLHNDTIITIKKANFCINMIEFKNLSFLKTLRKKLLWGEDKRN